MESSENLQQQSDEPVETKKIKKLRKLKIIIPVIVVAFLITAVCGIVSAKKKFGDGPGGFMIGMIVEKLDLTDIQKAQVEKIRDEIKTKMDLRKDNRDNMMEEFANEFKKDNMDKNKLKDLDLKREQNMMEMKDFMMDKLVEFHNLLTPEQRNKAVETMKEMKNKFHDHDRHDKNGMDSPEKNND
ncbi:MAG: Spy/CpxP family protein refolding chaperone [bacterium]